MEVVVLSVVFVDVLSPAEDEDPTVVVLPLEAVDPVVVFPLEAVDPPEVFSLETVDVFVDAVSALELPVS